MKKILFSLSILMLTLTLHAQYQVSFSLDHQPCNNDATLTATASAGMTPPFTVYWWTSGQEIIHTNVTTMSDVFPNYGGHNIYVQFVDANQQIAWGTFSAPPFTYTVNSTNPVCPALGTASLTNFQGGTAPYSVQWLEGTTVISTSNPVALPSGQYSIIVTDAAGCVANYIDSLYLWGDNPFTIVAGSTPANCTNGAVTVSSVTGGVAPYSYEWSNGANTQSINNLTQGYYRLTVTDAQGCRQFTGYEVIQGVQINPQTTTTPATCTQNDGAVTVFGSGGMPPYTYQWNNGQTGQTLNNLSVGSYQVVATDVNGCRGTGYAYINGQSPIQVTYSQTPSSCTSPTGTATLNISGGQAPYSVVWNTFPQQTGITATNLIAGNYGFNITDANGCTRTGTVPILPIHQITSNAIITPATCTASNGHIQTNPTGGDTPYTYQWSNGANTATIQNLSIGGYVVTITDNVGCSIVEFNSIGSNSPVEVGLSTVNTSCIFSNDGAVSATATGGTAPYTWVGGGVGNTITRNNLPQGYHYFEVTDANGCYAFNYTQISCNNTSNSCYGTIQGLVYKDLNGNCVQDAGENGIPNIQIYCSGIGYAYTNSAGYYAFQVPTGTYTIGETVQVLYPLAACQTNNIVVNIVAGTGNTQVVNFANEVETIHDVKISTWNISPPRPGFISQQQVIISNEGTVDEPTVIARYHHDGQLGVPTITPSLFFTPYGTNGYAIRGTNPLSLPYGSNQSWNFEYQTPTNIPLGTPILFKDTVSYAPPLTNWLNDYTPWNNVNYLNPLVVGAYDPNFKEVYPKGEGENGIIQRADSTLDYMVHFQNLGTYYAQNVVVLDTLDPDLDWKTLHPIYQSHPCTVTISEDGVAKFEFRNIVLPPKEWNEAASNGMFTYSIKTKKALQNGTQFKNSAAIFFDFNAPIITNTTVNTLVEYVDTENTATVKQNSFVLYPNPATQTLTIYINSEKAIPNTTLNVLDMYGRIVLNQRLSLPKDSEIINLDITSLPASVYFVQFDANSQTATQKFVKITP